MTVSKKEIDYNFETPLQKTWKGDDPKLDFKDGIFTGDNWNDARLSSLRTTIDNLVDIGDECELKVNGYLIKIKHVFDEDHHYVYINKITESKEDNYYIEWYKSRGCTELVKYNGNPITVEELRELLYLLNNCQ